MPFSKQVYHVEKCGKIRNPSILNLPCTLGKTVGYIIHFHVVTLSMVLWHSVIFSAPHDPDF